MLNLFKSPKEKTTSGIRPVVLLVLDGFGLAPASAGNAITQAKTPNIDRLYSLYPHGELIASGESVGLPANEVGNSEVGHLTMGAGRVIFQRLKRINAAIEDNSFFENRAFLHAASHLAKFNSKLHLMGLVSSGNVHSSLNHLYAILKFCKKADIASVYLHLFTDGRDAPPDQGATTIDQVEAFLKEEGVGKIATISGRYFAMDRDRRWKRTQKTYEAMVLGRGVYANTAIDAVKAAYSKGKTDEFIEPTVIVGSGKLEVGSEKENRTSHISNPSSHITPHTSVAKPIATVDDNDAVIFFNFRIDRPIQLTMAFVLGEFEKLKSFEFGHVPGMGKREEEVKVGTTFKREKIARNLFFVTMTEYHKKLPVSSVAFGPQIVEGSLSTILTGQGLRHVHIAESEKERMVTHYFDGLRDESLAGEDILIVPSPRVSTYDKKPQMSVYKLVKRFKKALGKGIYHFFIVNFANPDMVAHSGNIKATIRAVEHVDRAVAELIQEILSVDGTLIITADHGNAEELLAYPSTSFFFTTSEGELSTDHSNNPVPIIIVANWLAHNPKKLGRGSLGDVAPTILSIMGLAVPKLITGRNLLEGIVPAGGVEEQGV